MPVLAALPYVALAATAVGTGLDIAGNAESQAAENKTRSQENAQQQALQNKASQVTATNVQASSPANVNKELSAGAGNRENAWEGLNQITTPVASALPATGAPASPTANAEKVSNSAGNTWNNLVSGNAAKMGSYSDLATEQGIQDQNTAEQLGEINNFSQGDAGLLPLEMDVASQRGGPLSGWGSIVSSLGNLVGLANAAGAFGQNTPQVQGTYGPYSSSSNWSTPGAPVATPPATNWSTTVPMSQPGNPNFWSTIYK